MLLLCLTDREVAAALPNLELLPHEVHSSPLHLGATEQLAARFDAILIDGAQDPRLARRICMSFTASFSTPRIVILDEAALTALTPEWGVAEVIIPSASAAEVEARLRMLGSRLELSTGWGESNGSHGGRHSLAWNGAACEDIPAELKFAGVVIDEATFSARVHGRALDLTYKEYELLHFLAAHPGRVFTREQLLGGVWGSDYFGGTRTVDVHVRRLRAKLGDHEALISTVRGVGYGFARTREESDSQ